VVLLPHCFVNRLTTVGDMNFLGAKSIGEGVASIVINDVAAESNAVIIVTDKSIPIDIIISRTWLDLPHVNYFKKNNTFVVKSIHINTTMMKQLPLLADHDESNVEAFWVVSDWSTHVVTEGMVPGNREQCTRLVNCI